MLAGPQRLLGEAVVGGDRRRDDDGVDRRVFEDVVEVDARLDRGVLARDAIERGGVPIADRDEIGLRQRGEVAHEVRTPVPDPDDGAAQRRRAHAVTRCRTSWTGSSEAA